VTGRVEGKVAIVTGAASGIGAATSRRLASEGARVLLCDVNEEGLAKLAAELGDPAEALTLDVVDEARWREVVAHARERLGRLDVLVNNAGIVERADVEETTLEQWRRIQSVNAEGVFLGCKHALPAMRASGGGSIVNVSSLAALRGTPIYAAYSASKGAVAALTRTVALHCLERGDAIRCNSIHPGGVNTPMVHAVVKEGSGLDLTALDPEVIRRSLGMGDPADIANLVLFLASDESGYINGAELCIDGGLTVSTARPDQLGPAGGTGS
jgi:3(or 17)beta-hydroxysteroid dehydrogenase